MKLHEAIDLYSLHKDPTQLDKYNKAKDDPAFRPARWVRFDHSAAGGFQVVAGISSISDIKKGMEPSEFGFDSFDIESLELATQDTEEQYSELGEDIVRKYAATRAKFLDQVRTIQPQTVIYADRMNDGQYTDNFSIIVTEHGISLVHSFFGHDPEAYG